ncbi:MAG TPA: hypothetical protein VJ739_06500 [Gemmataceae bacterium]|nr:hypothetical protein [Gemmataceae bacterium]
MATRRVIKGVLGNFLGTYVSRYSDYGGYLLFGFLVGTLDELRINLLGQSASDSRSPTGAAALLAAARFEEQRQKAHLPASRIREAELTIRRLPGLVTGSINGRACPGYNVSFRVAAVMDNDKRYERERVEFIAPQEVALEFLFRRSGQGD